MAQAEAFALRVAWDVLVLVLEFSTRLPARRDYCFPGRQAEGVAPEALQGADWQKRGINGPSGRANEKAARKALNPVEVGPSFLLETLEASNQWV